MRQTQTDPTQVARELDRRVAERTRELAESNQALQLQVGLLQHLPVSAWTLKPDGTPDFVNQVWLDYSGQTLEFVRSHPEAWMTAVHPEDLENAQKAFWEGVRSGQGFAMEFRTLRARDGVYRWHLNRAVVLRDAEGKVLKFVGTTTDIDDQKRAEEALRASEARLRRVIDTIPSLSWCNLPDGPNEFLSKGWHDYTGLSPEEAHGWGWAAAFHPDDLPPLMKRWQELLVSGESGEIEARIRRHDGEYRWFLIRVAPFRDDTGAILRWYGTSTDIQERKLTDEALRASETNLRQIVNSIPGLICTMSPSGEIEHLNQPLLEYFGKTPEELKGWRMTDAVHPDDLPDVIKAYTYSITTGTPYEIEHRCRRADGVYRWFQVRASAVRDADGNITGWYVLLTDIDDRKRAEDGLRANANDLRKILDSIPGLVCNLSPTGQIELANQELLNYFGRSLDEINAWAMTDAIHPDDLPHVIEHHTRSMTTGTPYDFEFRCRRADGVYLWFQARNLPMHDSNGMITGWSALMTDIEDRKRAEEALRASENNLRNVLDNIPGMVSMLGPTGGLELSNRPFLEYFNKTIEEIQNWSSNGLVHPDDLPNAIASFTRSIETGEPLHLEHRLRRADGVYQWVLSSGRPVRDAEGRIERWYVLTTDIDDRKRAEDALRASESNFRQIVDNVPGLVATLSPKGEIELVNQQFLDYFGKSLGEINSWRVNDVLHPDDLHRVETAFSHAMTTGSAFVEELRYRRADGVHRWFHARVFPVLDPDGRIERWYALATDIEDQKRAEDALNELRSELAYMARVSSLGALTGSIAHEVNQPLSGIVTNASVCMRTLSSDPPDIDAAREAAQRIIRDGKRASEVISRLRALFSRKESTAEPVDLNEAAREVIALCLEELQKNRVILRQELANDLPRVTGDRVQLQQVMLNLLKNASDAMIGIDDRPRELVIRTEKDQGDCVRLTVKDSGVGIAPRDMERLFEAFYTTKSDGMGMGLSISRSIIERHSGRLWAAPNDGPGAAFSFSMPCRFEAVASHPTTG